eukprot:GHVT01078733.1.p1 GENE.GHVT01078733.1~~GHVT01078733.1.p1  ORF type:complete len:181 (-),score=16.91 GHVT01078733.1:331-873(-)
MENAPFTTPPFPSPSASDPVTKLQIGINNTFYLVTDAVVEMTERAPPCDVSGRITPSSESLPSSEFTEEQLKEWVAKLSDDVGLLLEMTGDEVDKLPTSTRSKVSEHLVSLKFCSRTTSCKHADLYVFVPKLHSVSSLTENGSCHFPSLIKHPWLLRAFDECCRFTIVRDYSDVFLAFAL